MTVTQYEDFALMDGVYELPNGTTLRIWSQADGQWACAAKDHGPFCRRYRPMESEDEGQLPGALISNVIDGLLSLVDDPNRGWLFQQTEAGTAHAEAILERDGIDPDDFKTWDKDQLREYLSDD